MAHSTIDSGTWDDLPDADLVVHAREGRQEAFVALFDRYARPVYNITWRIVGSPTEAEDLTQETFLRAYRTLGALRAPQAFAAWLYRIATTVSLDAARRTRVPQAELSDAVLAVHPDEARWSSPEAAATADEDRRAVRAALARLAPTQRAALTLREIQGMSYGEIAAALGTSAGATEVLLFRARRRFRAEYVKVAVGGARDAPTVRCATARASLAAVLDEEGGRGTRRAAVLAHLRGCAACQNELAAQRAAARARLLLPLMPVPAAVKGHVLAGLVAHGAAAAATGTGAAATTPIASGGATGATATGAKLVALGGTKGLLLAAGVTAAVGVAVATPLLRRHDAVPSRAPARGRPAATTSRPTPSRVVRAPAIAAPAPTAPVRIAMAAPTAPVRIAMAAPTAPVRIAMAAPTAPVRIAAPAPMPPGRKLSLVTMRPVPLPPPPPVAQTVVGHMRIRHSATRAIGRVSGTTTHLIAHTFHPVRRPIHAVARRGVAHTVAQRPRHTVAHRVVHVHRRIHRAGHRAARRIVRRASLSVGGLGRYLHFDHPETLRIATLPGAWVTVTLRIAHAVGSTGAAGRQRVHMYRFTLRARADRAGHATVPLRYTYVPTRPDPVALTITARTGRGVVRRTMALLLVRR